MKEVTGTRADRRSSHVPTSPRPLVKRYGTRGATRAAASRGRSTSARTGPLPNSPSPSPCSSSPAPPPATLELTPSPPLTAASRSCKALQRSSIEGTNASCKSSWSLNEVTKSHTCMTMAISSSANPPNSAAPFLPGNGKTGDDS